MLLIKINNEKNKKINYENVIAVGTVVEGNNRTLIGTNPTYKNPIIPVGFKAVDVGTSWEISGDSIVGWNDGLVIEDKKGSQFVWVPVDGKNVLYEKWCFDSLHYGPSFEDVTGEDISFEFDEMYQIEKYQGFWIARYESGRSDVNYATPEINNVSTGIELLIQKDAQPWNYISYTNSKIVAEGYINNEYVKSGLPTGTQFDTVLKWIENSGYNVTEDSIEWGNYFNSDVRGYGKHSFDSNYTGQIWQVGEYFKDVPRVLYVGTGAYEKSQAKNIYDLAGGVREWTTEEYQTEDVYFHISRGGNVHGNSYEVPASYRSMNKETYISSLLGFRVVLFVM